MPDSLTTDAKLIKAYRERRAMLDHLPDEVRRITERREIDEAVNTWLGVDLRSLTHDGAPLWSGDRDSLEIRDAWTDEAQRWHASLQHAIDTGEQGAGDENWLVFLVSVSKIDEEGWC
jgi:hypothetical protein